MICPQCQSQNPESARFCEACGIRLNKPEAATSPTAPGAAVGIVLHPGEVFAERYRIDAEIGRGWMGIVYSADDTRTEHRLALKLVRPDRLVAKDAMRRVVREVAMSRDIRHPNVVAVYDAGEAAGVVYVATELLPGASLWHYNRQQLATSEGWPLATALEIVRQLLAGLGAAHAVGVVHRDLKPANIILADDPAKRVVLKMTDFALAAASGSTETGVTGSGSTSYVSPEQMVAPEAVKPSADLYSVSAIFYELLTGVASAGVWQPPSAGRSDVPAGIDKLIERGLSNNPRARPQTAGDYLNELEAAIAGSTKPPLAPQPDPPPQLAPSAAASSSPAQPSPPPARKSLSALTIGAIAVGALGIAIVGALALNGSETPRPNPDTGLGKGGLPAPSQTAPVAPAPLPPPPEPAPTALEMLSGFWTDDFGNYLDIIVDRGGAVTGQVVRGPMLGYALAGQFDGDDFEFQVGTALGAVSASYGVRTDACHVQYQTVDAYGRAAQSMIHMNHLPGQPCP